MYSARVKKKRSDTTRDASARGLRSQRKELNCRTSRVAMPPGGRASGRRRSPTHLPLRRAPCGAIASDLNSIARIDE